MKFVKENLTLVICGAVAVILLVLAFAPIPAVSVPGMKAELREKMVSRFAKKDDVDRWSRKDLELPGLPKEEGIPPQAWVEVKTTLIESVTQAQKDVEAAAGADNMRGRVADGVPVLPLPTTADLARSPGVPQKGYLPRVTGDALAFKAEYGKQFRVWTGLLATGARSEMDSDAAMPPKSEALRVEWERRQGAVAASQPGGMGMGMGFNPGSSAQSSQEMWNWQKRQIVSRAKGLKMYVGEGALQIRPWYFLDNPPNAKEIFEAFVDSWLQFDLVKAIIATNSAAQAAAVEKDVSTAAVKRLTRVVVGNNARVRYLNSTASSGGMGGGGGTTGADPGMIFFTSTSSSGQSIGLPVMGPPVADGNAGVASSQPSGLVLPDVANAPNYLLGMTGRSAGKTYDVVYLSVVVDIDQSQIVRFMDQIYRQNMGYSVVNMQTRAVDPLDRASNGFLYGNAPVVELELLVECVMFRNWTVPLMPDLIKYDVLGGRPATQ